jgi:hypothetical protein
MPACKGWQGAVSPSSLAALPLTLRKSCDGSPRLRCSSKGVPDHTIEFDVTLRATRDVGATMRDRPGRHGNRRAHNRRCGMGAAPIAVPWDDDGNRDWEGPVVDVYRVDNTIRGVTGTGPTSWAGGCVPATTTSATPTPITKPSSATTTSINTTLCTVRWSTSTGGSSTSSSSSSC